MVVGSRREGRRGWKHRDGYLASKLMTQVFQLVLKVRKADGIA
jgi:hypothetical protein